MYKIKFKYSLLKDIKTYFEISSKKEWLKKQNIKVFGPSVSRFFKIIFNRPKIVLESDIPVTCYWVTNGTWGAYEDPNKIIIMPFNLPDDMTLSELMKHEIMHLKHPEAEDMDHKEKEKYIEEFEKVEKEDIL